MKRQAFTATNNQNHRALRREFTFPPRRAGSAAFPALSAWCAAVLLALVLFGCSRSGKSIEEQYGVEIQGARLSANGYMIDFRYRILDPEKAVPLADRNAKPVLTAQATGAKLGVPAPPLVGPLRQTSRFLKAGRTYFIMFANPGVYVKSGDQVTVSIGNFTTKPITVQ